jgi:cytochrome b
MQEAVVEESSKNFTEVKVWDLPIRLFHWTLVIGVAAAYISAKYRFSDVHVLVGYALCVLILARVSWGIAGTKYARFTSFCFPFSETAIYLRTMLHGKPRHYVGHNPAGALMVFTMLALLTLIFLTGLATLGAIDFDGPLSALANYLSDEASFLIRHLHAWLVNIGIALVALHLAGVMWGSVQHRENLVKAMITGNKSESALSGTDSGINK